MVPVDLKCTNCGAALASSGAAPPGAPIRCQYCGHTFDVPAPRAATPEVVRIEIVAPGRAMGAAPRPRKSAGGCLFAPLLFLGIMGWVAFSFLRAGKSESHVDVGGVQVGIPGVSSSNERLLWDDVGGPPAITTVAGREIAVGRLRMESDQLYVAAIGAASPRVDWRFGPLGKYSDAYRFTHFGVAGNRVLVTDAQSAVHVVDPATGKEIAKATLTDKIDQICVVHASGAIWVGAIDKRGASLDPATGATHAAPRPAGCEEILRSERSDATPAAALPKIDGFRAHAVLVDGDAAVAAGTKYPGTETPLAVGFDPKTHAVRWNEPVASLDPSRVKEHSATRAALSAGRFVASYEVAPKGWHVAALDAKSGARLWDTPLRPLFSVDEISSVTASPSYAYVVRGSSLEVLDAKTGKLVGVVGNETYAN